MGTGTGTGTGTRRGEGEVGTNGRWCTAGDDIVLVVEGGGEAPAPAALTYLAQKEQIENFTLCLFRAAA